jgi:hypothetical protein
VRDEQNEIFSASMLKLGTNQVAVRTGDASLYYYEFEEGTENFRITFTPSADVPAELVIRKHGVPSQRTHVWASIELDDEGKVVSGEASTASTFTWQTDVQSPIAWRPQGKWYLAVMARSAAEGLATIEITVVPLAAGAGSLAVSAVALLLLSLVAIL